MSHAVRIALLAAAGVLVLSACNTYTVPKIKQVQVQETQLDSGRKMPKLACPYRLVRVDDSRPGRDDSGNLGLKFMHLEDAPGVVSRLLQEDGLPGADATGQDVVVTLEQMYMAQNLEVKIPVVVYGVSVGGAAPFLVRSKSDTLNWWGTKGEAHAGYARALADANYRLLANLNERCPRG
jgi:hypothetical protein